MSSSKKQVTSTFSPNKKTNHQIVTIVPPSKLSLSTIDMCFCLSKKCPPEVPPVGPTAAMVRRLEPPREVLVLPSTPRPLPCENCACERFQVAFFCFFLGGVGVGLGLGWVGSGPLVGWMVGWLFGLVRLVGDVGHFSFGVQGWHRI